MRTLVFLGLSVLVASLNSAAHAGDWPQYLHDAAHSGDAADDSLQLPLKLVAQVRLDDAVLTSPAVVEDKAFVVDQMGTAYCVDAAEGRIVWKVSPEGAAAMGSNTSSPCIAGGRMVYGTTTGNLHILDLQSGKLVRTIQYGQPILGSITSANDSIYLQTLDAVVHCLDRDGNTRWQWDHYNVLSDDPAAAQAERHYGGVAVSVAGNRVVIAAGFDLVCVEDRGDHARHLWTSEKPIGAVYLPVGTSIGSDHVYCAFPGKDGYGAVLRVSLIDGRFAQGADVLHEQWAALAAPAVRDTTAYFSRQAFGVTAQRFGSQRGTAWASFNDEPETFTPSLSSPALSREHCVFTTLVGELVAVDLAAHGRGLANLSAEVFRFQTPHGKPITSSPAIADGRVYFGCDDGFLYVLGQGEAIEPRTEELTLHRRESHVEAAGARRYTWPSAYGGPSNANFVEDAGLKPPFTVRWAAHSGGLFKHPAVATDEDVVYSTLGGWVVCREQSSGRIRWRRKLPKQVWTRATPLLADGNLYVPRMFSPRYPKVRGQGNALYCLDMETGAIRWERPIGSGDRLRASPVFADGVVAYGSLYDQPGVSRPLVPRGATWRYQDQSDPAGDWTAADFDDSAWPEGPAGFGYGDEDDATRLDLRDRSMRVYVRKAFELDAVPQSGQLALELRYDDGFIAYLNGQEIARASVGRGAGSRAERVSIHEAEQMESFPIDAPRELLRPGRNVLAIEGHNATLDSSDFTLHPSLVIVEKDDSIGQVVDAWDADTGEPLWQVAIASSGQRLNGPAGCAGDGRMYFTGGGESPGSMGETIAVLPRTGEVVWRKPDAFASQTGTPSYRDGRLYLPGSYKLPLACLDARDGSIVWQQEEGRNHWFVETVSLGPDYFTVNNKYNGGALRWNLATGTMAGTPDERVQLWGPAHGCGAVVLTSEGMALSATIDGLFMTDTSTGEVLWKSPGFASYTCPHAIPANGRIFYCPQTSGVMFCFEPVEAD